MLANIRQLFRYRELVWIWIQRDIRVRYKQSLLGIAWAILQPLSVMLMFSLIFTRFVKIPVGDTPYPVFSYAALLPWTFFSTAVTFAMPSLVNNMHLVTKVYFPREIFPIAAIGASLVDYGFGALVFVGLLLIYRLALNATLLLIPLLILIQLALTAGIVLFTATLNVYFRDVRFVVPLALQLWLYATPVIYPVSVVPEAIRPIYMLNPMAGLIEAYRAVALAGVWPDWPSLGVAALVSAVLCLGGYWFFKRMEWQFADVI